MGIKFVDKMVKITVKVSLCVSELSFIITEQKGEIIKYKVRWRIYIYSIFIQINKMLKFQRKTVRRKGEMKP